MVDYAYLCSQKLSYLIRIYMQTISVHNFCNKFWVGLCTPNINWKYGLQCFCLEIECEGIPPANFMDDTKELSPLVKSSARLISPNIIPLCQMLHSIKLKSLRGVLDLQQTSLEDGLKVTVHNSAMVNSIEITRSCTAQAWSNTPMLIHLDQYLGLTVDISAVMTNNFYHLMDKWWNPDLKELADKKLCHIMNI